MQRDSFRAMGTTVTVLVEAESADLTVARAEFERLEQIMSRFLAELGAVPAERRGRDRRVAGARRGRLGRGRGAHGDRRTLLHATDRARTYLWQPGDDRTFDEIAVDGPATRPMQCGGEVTVDGMAHHAR